jgi:hypothetical protein
MVFGLLEWTNGENMRCPSDKSRKAYLILSLLLVSSFVIVSFAGCFESNNSNGGNAEFPNSGDSPKVLISYSSLYSRPLVLEDDFKLSEEKTERFDDFSMRLVVELPQLKMTKEYTYNITRTTDGGTKKTVATVINHDVGLLLEHPEFSTPYNVSLHYVFWPLEMVGVNVCGVNNYINFTMTLEENEGFAFNMDHGFEGLSGLIGPQDGQDRMVYVVPRGPGTDDKGHGILFTTSVYSASE